jgi:hypothetical protein
MSLKRYTPKPRSSFRPRQCPVSPPAPIYIRAGENANASTTETPEDFFKYNFGYDIVRDSVLAMEKENPEWKLPDTFFEKTPGKGVYPS